MGRLLCINSKSIEHRSRCGSIVLAPEWPPKSFYNESHRLSLLNPFHLNSNFRFQTLNLSTFYRRCFAFKRSHQNCHFVTKKKRIAPGYPKVLRFELRIIFLSVPFVTESTKLEKYSSSQNNIGTSQNLTPIKKRKKNKTKHFSRSLRSLL